MGPIGTQEMVFIFLLALVLFGPKKLPEIGRTVGRAITEFRRASNELKTTFDREISSLEAETKDLKEIGSSIQQEAYNYNYDYSSYESTYEGSYNPEDYDSQPAAITASASAPQDAEATAAAPLEGTVAQGTEIAALENRHAELSGTSVAEPVPDPHPASDPSTAAGHNS
jgi:sec-independent protein translocase protein TatA